MSTSIEPARHPRAHVAYHEAGHAVIAHVLGFEVRRVTIVPDDKSRGRMVWNKPPANLKKTDADLTPSQRQRIENLIMVALAGPLTMRHHNPRSHWKKSGTGYGPFMGKGTDFQVAAKLIDILYQNEAVASAYWRFTRVRAESLVKERWAWIDCVARHLLEHKTFDGDIRTLNPRARELDAVLKVALWPSA